MQTPSARFAVTQNIRRFRFRGGRRIIIFIIPFYARKFKSDFIKIRIVFVTALSSSGKIHLHFLQASPKL
jgi:hypothetical protein